MENKVTNCIQLTGTIARDLECDYKEIDDNGLFKRKTLINVKRRSGIIDTIPLVLEPSVLRKADFIPQKGENVFVSGVITTKSIRRADNQGRNYLKYVLVNNISREPEHLEDKNEVFLVGEIQDTPTYRVTPSGKKISDFHLNCKISDEDIIRRIPCIAWGSTAEYISYMNHGDIIKIAGRFQSRAYIKIDENGYQHHKTAYEVSVMNLF